MTTKNVQTETVQKYINEYFSCSENCVKYDVNKITEMFNQMIKDLEYLSPSEYDKMSIRQSLVFSVDVPTSLNATQFKNINQVVDFIITGKVD